MSKKNVIKKSNNFVSRLIADETIIVPVSDNTADLEYVFALNETAGRVWQLIDAKHSKKEIIDILADEFNASAEEIETDLNEFFEQLESSRLIQD